MHDECIRIVLSAPRPECTSDYECPTHLACIREKCQDPCQTHTCGINAECTVRNHRALCICLAGFVGDPFTICEERKLVTYLFVENSFSFVFHKSTGYTSKIPNFLLAGCKSDSECPLTQACISRECQNPCNFEQCGVNAECSVRNHRPKCTCLPGHKGNPYDRCRQYECLTDPECATTLTCRNEKCVDPCDCALNADCTAINHRGICECFPDHTGDPYGRICDPSKIYSLSTKNFFPIIVQFE